MVKTLRKEEATPSGAAAVVLVCPEGILCLSPVSEQCASLKRLTIRRMWNGGWSISGALMHPVINAVTRVRRLSHKYDIEGTYRCAAVTGIVLTELLKGRGVSRRFDFRHSLKSIRSYNEAGKSDGRCAGVTQMEPQGAA
jgi:hypothetical protein